jgi:diphthamide synthase (EF-2-diphthine--ammonia ligase)
VLAERFVNEGYEAYLTCVDTSQLDAAFAGLRFDHALLTDLPAGVDPCGENGEFHTCVVDGPVFRERVAVTVGERVRRDQRFEFCDLLLDSH